MSNHEVYGLGVYYGDATTFAESTTWTAITNLTNCNPPEETVNDVDTSHLKSIGKTKTSKPGWKVPGEITFTAQYTAEDYASLAAENGKNHGFKILFEDTTTDGSNGDHAGGIGFDGYFKRIKLTGGSKDDDSLVTVEGTIKVSGATTAINAQETSGE